MNNSNRRQILIPLFSLLLLSSRPASSDDMQRNLSTFPNENGVAQSFDSAGPLDTTGPFFQSLGSNGRSCVTCHQPGDNWSVTPKSIRARFDRTQGTDPIFRTNDGANCDTLDVSTVAARRAAYSQLLDKGLIRVTVAVPTNAEFTVANVVNPYGCTDTTTLSLYRRPLPSTNLRFLTTVMWDGRESFAGNTLDQNLRHQANDATTGHAQGSDLTEAVQAQIVAFEMSLTTAQMVGPSGKLDVQGERGGPLALFSQPFFVGVNDPLGPGPFNPAAFDIFPTAAGPDPKRQSIARGEALFNNRTIHIQGVKGLNDLVGAADIPGTCTTCHNAPNVGNHSVPLAIDVGVSDPVHRTPDMPLFLLVNKTTGATIQTMDPGRALITGKWNDIGKTKGPILRGLSGRAPYFHNGSAATLMDAVEFYDTRFSIGFTRQEKDDLVNFLSSL
jgi:cytochrome c peroxidase